MNEHGNEAMKAESEVAGYEWIGVGRKGRSGGGVGILIKKDMEWEEVGSFAANVKWVFVKGLGYVAGVYVPPSGSFSNDPPFDDIIKDTTTRAAIFKEKGKGGVWVLGDFNARTGELPNRVCGYGEVKRTSDDSVVTPRGKRLIEEMNRVGLWLINGYGAKAGSTFANSGGESCIDLVWCSAQEEARRGCTEWGDAVCMISDHALVMVETECTTQIERTREERKQGWRRIASAGWTSERDNRWVEWCIKQRHGTIQETWSEWKMTFNQQATRWIGKNKSRKTNHWKARGTKNCIIGQGVRIGSGDKG